MLSNDSNKSERKNWSVGNLINPGRRDVQQEGLTKLAAGLQLFHKSFPMATKMKKRAGGV